MSQKAQVNTGRTGGSSAAKPVVFTTGLVSQVDDAKGLARCKLPDLDDLETYWLRVLQRGTGTNKDYWMPDVGDQVMIVADENLEDGCILGAIYSDADQPPVNTREKYHVTFGNGSVIEFDRSTGVLKIEVTKIEITCTEESLINSKAIAVIGAMDNDSESNGPDALVTSGQL